MMLVNGQVAESLSLTDRALHYGDGLFETVLLRQGELRLWQRHLARLQQSCQRLSIPLDSDALQQDLVTLLAENPQEGVVKIIVSRGGGGRGYAPPQDPRPVRIVQLHPASVDNQRRAEQGVSVLMCQHPLSVNPALAGLKHLNRLDQVMASMELRGHDEGLMCDPEGHVVEGIRSNLFVVTGQRIVTPDLSGAGVAGIMRALLSELFNGCGMHVDVEQIGHDDIRHARELFVCNSVFGIWPVTRVDWRDKTMTFAIGAQTRRAQHWLREAF